MIARPRAVNVSVAVIEVEREPFRLALSIHVIDQKWYAVHCHSKQPIWYSIFCQSVSPAYVLLLAREVDVV